MTTESSVADIKRNCLGMCEFKLPRTGPFIYFLFRNDQLIYIGRTTNLIVRLSQHIHSGKDRFDEVYFYDFKGKRMIDGFSIDRIERAFIRIYKPRLNRILKKEEYTDEDLSAVQCARLFAIGYDQ